MKRTANAVWNGTLKEGNGKISTQSKTLNDVSYSFSSRFEEGQGTNPEELIAAAHAGCFSMKFSALLTNENFKPESIETSCAITIENLTIITAELTCKAKIPGISKEDFDRISNEAKEKCPISKLLNTTITLNAELI